jgi:hypothetical protein
MCAGRALEVWPSDVPRVLPYGCIFDRHDLPAGRATPAHGLRIRSKPHLLGFDFKDATPRRARGEHSPVTAHHWANHGARRRGKGFQSSPSDRRDDDPRTCRRRPHRGVASIPGLRATTSHDHREPFHGSSRITRRTVATEARHDRDHPIRSALHLSSTHATTLSNDRNHPLDGM